MGDAVRSVREYVNFKSEALMNALVGCKDCRLGYIFNCVLKNDHCIEDELKGKAKSIRKSKLLLKQNS